jgi:hypothetical protein
VKITIESTLRLTDVNGIPARIWKGVTEQGHAVDVLVSRIGASGAAQAEFNAAVDRGEITLQAPTVEEALRDALFARQAHHERTCPGGGKPCWKDRAEIIAWLAHALGLGKHPGGMIEVLAALETYDRNCKSADCSHNR